MPDPGPPRFTTVDESILLSPHRPDASATYRWSVVDGPEESTATVGDGDVVEFDPDVAGRYRLRITGPDGSQDVTVRVLPSTHRDSRFAVRRSRIPVPEDQLDDVSICGHFCSIVEGREHPTVGEEYLYYDCAVPPGEHPFYMTTPDRSSQAWETRIVPGPQRPRITLDAEATDEGTNLEAEVLPSGNTDETQGDLDVEFYLDDRDDAELTVSGRTATVRLPPSADRARVYAIAVGCRPSVADAVTVTRTDVTSFDEPPQWIHDAVVYSANVRWFAGSLSKFQERLGYLERLGVDCLYLLPIQQHDGEPHGYHITDFFSVADDIGSRETFERLVEACHDRGIRVVLDLVANHSSREHPAFDPDDPTPDGEGLYAWEDGTVETYYDWDDVANFDPTSLEARELLLDIVDHWAPLVDGFRCDAVHCLPHDFWKQIRARLREQDSEFLLIDEALPYAPRFHEGEFDVHYDNILAHRLTEIGKDNMPAASLLDVPGKRSREGTPQRATFLQYVESHDEDRYVDACGPDAQRAAVAATFCLPGVPMIYAGQEIAHDRQRGPIPWNDGDRECWKFHARLTDLWKDLPALRRGSFEPVDWRAASASVVAFAREYRGERVVAVLNFGTEPAEVSVEEPVSTDLWTDADVDDTVTVSHLALLAGEDTTPSGREGQS